MIKIPHKYLLGLCITLLLFISSSVFAEEIEVSPTLAPVITPIAETKSNDALDVLKARQEKLKENFKISDVDKEESKAKEELQNAQIKKETIQEINKKIEQELSALKLDLKNLNKVKFDLEKKIDLSEEEKKTQQFEIERLKKSEQELQKNVNFKAILLEKNKQDLEKLSQEEELKRYALAQVALYKIALQEKHDEETDKKIKLFTGVSIFFLLFYIVRLLGEKKYCHSKKCKKKYGHRFVTFDIFGLLTYLGFVVWFLFYLKPEMVVYLLFLVGAIVIVLQEYIFSVVSSVFIVQLYHVGDRIRFKKNEGIIEGMTLLKISIRTIDSIGVNMQEIRMIPNSEFMKQEVVKLPKTSIEKTTFDIVLPNDLSVDLPRFMADIEGNVLQKNITVRSENEITDSDFFYEVDFYFMPTGQPVIKLFWQETREKNNRIKRKILAELEKVKKNNIYSDQTSVQNKTNDSNDNSE
ncbi:TPA: mechanosensitive ion channel [Candidatus Gracilibacteria bacterium]|nr:mechanosensitive ion channel [Candidatus Gracilibacteria bacterium]